MAVAALTTNTLVVLSYLTVPISGVKVTGARMFPESQASNAVPARTSLLTLNTESLEQEIGSNPWVKRAVVTRNWRSGIVTVHVEERRVILDAEVDGRRVILTEDGTEVPSLGGASLGRVALDEDQLVEILKFARVLESRGIRLDAVDGVGPGGMEVSVEGRRVVFSGSVTGGQAHTLEAVMGEHPGARDFDLRTPRRVVVGAPAG